ncbi:MAG: serine protease [Gammaproteobacteria bacterium]|nr:serine protease [Gammaproteobacteria bacterium]
MNFVKSLVFVTGVILCNLAGVQASSAQTNIETRIVGGTQSSASDWPWMVLLSTTTSTSNFFCGATLIADQWLLTAAHCVDGRTAAGVHAFVGLYDKSAPTSPSIAVTQIIIHPNYDSNTSNNDIALLKLGSVAPEIPLKIITPTEASMLEGQADDLANDVYALGWGDTEDPVLGTSPDILREVFMPYVSNVECNLSMNGQITDNMMCAGLISGGVDTCQGDSGGPLVYFDGIEWFQSGVVSWGYGCADAGNYGVYTRVANYIGWIQRAVNGVTPSVDFGTWVAGKTAKAQIDIDNSTGQEFTILSEITSTNAAFVVSHNCPIYPVTMTAGSSCVINLTFSESIVNIYEGNIVINTDHPVLGVAEVDVVAKLVDKVNFGLVQKDSSIEWALAGNSAWVERQVTVDGSYSFQSGDITDNEYSSLLAYVSLAPGVASQTVWFDWKVCSEFDYDFLELWVDNKKVAARSGNADWAVKYINLLGEGDHVIEWRYNKDYSVTNGFDAGWVNNVELGIKTRLTPVHIAECRLEPAPSGRSSGALSLWFYLGLVIPLMIRRRFKKLN